MEHFINLAFKLMLYHSTLEHRHGIYINYNNDIINWSGHLLHYNEHSGTIYIELGTTRPKKGMHKNTIRH